MLRHIDVTENFGLRETGRWKRYFFRFSNFQIWNDFWKILWKGHSFLWHVLSSSEVLQRNWVLWCRIFWQQQDGPNFTKFEQESIFFTYFFWIKKMLQTYKVILHHCKGKVILHHCKVILHHCILVCKTCLIWVDDIFQPALPTGFETKE